MMRRGLYHDPLLGLDNVWLENGYERVRTACGPGVSFKDLNGLHREIARAIVMSPSPMSMI
jgi:hypothetical protein